MKHGNVFRIRKEYFTRARDEIAARNLTTMTTAGWVGALITLLLILATPLIVKQWKVTAEYIVLIPTLLSFSLFAALYKKKERISPAVTDIACMLFYCAVFIELIFVSVFPYPSGAEVFVSLFIMLMPALFSIRPYKTLIISVAGGALFIWLVLTQGKTPDSANHDVFATIAALVLARAVSAYIYGLRINDYTSRVTLEQISSTDELAGTLNKSAFEQAAAKYINEGGVGEMFAFMITDIDDFKNVNDTHGHIAGDGMIRIIGESLKKVFRASDILGRVGGDEFCVVMKNVPRIEIVENRINTVRSEIERRAANELFEKHSCSVGAVMCVTEAISYEECFKKADAALYGIKQSGKDGFMIVDIDGRKLLGSADQEGQHSRHSHR